MKIKSILRFAKTKSIFSGFKMDTKEVFNNCFEADKKHLRIHKLTKDQDDAN